MPDWQDTQQRYQERVNRLLEAHLSKLSEIAPTLKQAMQYGLLIGGKRIRPFLTYATGEMLGAKLSDLDPSAMAIECIHAFSLIHDDLPAMDDDDLRRGKPTCHIAFDEATAILAGDALQTLAFDILLNHELSSTAERNRLALLKTLTCATGYDGMCGGQAMDIDATGRVISLEQLEQLQKRKTGALIETTLKMAYLSSPVQSEEVEQSLAEYAQAIGLAFQVRDDILDVVSDTEILGKPQGSDIALNKSTYPDLLGLEGAQDFAQELYQQALQALASLPYNTQVLESFAGYIVNRNK
ncbi:(2E,6E)-farnesyl diphosphate synthase [Alteromonadaceae bacterium M269]|nr:(2E,6E)-farnesyl diphosphate synthase [Alteromonadaceae bacterium M269]